MLYDEEINYKKIWHKQKICNFKSWNRRQQYKIHKVTLSSLIIRLFIIENNDQRYSNQKKLADH